MDSQHRGLTHKDLQGFQNLGGLLTLTRAAAAAIITLLLLATQPTHAQNTQIPILVKKDGQYALANNNNKVLSAYYDAIFDFEYGHAIVQRDTHFGIINQQGKEIYPVRYGGKEIASQYIQSIEKNFGNTAQGYLYLASRVENDSALCFSYLKKAYALDSTNAGHVLKIADVVKLISEDKALVYFEKAYELDSTNIGTALYIGDSYKENNEIKALRYYRRANQLKPDAVKLKEKFYFLNGIAAIKKEEKQFGVIDTTGKLLTKEWYDGVWANKKNTVIELKKDGKWIIINNKGEFVGDWHGDGGYYSEGLCFIQNLETKKWGAIDEKGILIIKYLYDSEKLNNGYYIFKNGKAKVKQGEETFWINKKGERVAAPDEE